MASNENFRRRSESGWQRNNRLKQFPPILPEEPTRFHRFLYSIGVRENEIQGALESATRKKIVEWARRHADSCYIPTHLLQDAGIRTRYD